MPPPGVRPAARDATISRSEVASRFVDKRQGTDFSDAFMDANHLLQTGVEPGSIDQQQVPFLLRERFLPAHR